MYFANIHIRWANATEVKSTLESIFVSLFGTKEAAAAAAAAKPKAKAPKAAEKPVKPVSTTAAVATKSSSATPAIPTNIFEEGFLPNSTKSVKTPRVIPS